MYRAALTILPICLLSCASSMANQASLNKAEYRCTASYCKETTLSNIYVYKGGHIDRQFTDYYDICPVVP